MKRITKVMICLLVIAIGFLSCTGYNRLTEKQKGNIISPPQFNKGDGKSALPGCEIYKVGVGVADITEYPCEQINGGYAELKQNTKGIHTRQKVKAFIIGDKSGKKVVFLVIDDWAVSIEMRELLVQKLATGIFKNKFGEEVMFRDEFGNTDYNIHNIMMTASHTHCGVMGDAERREHNISAGGHTPELMHITVDGCARAIVMAHQNLQNATIEFAKDKLIGRYNVSKNRSISSHLNNKKDKYIDVTPDEFFKMSPEEQEKLRNHPMATDKNMYLLRLRSYPEGKDLGLLNWFSIHGTSVSASNSMISADNRGVAQQMVEEVMGTRPDGKNDFVAGFATSALGDVGSSRIIYYTDKFGYKLSEEIENVIFSARAQASRALEIYANPQLPVKGKVGFAMQYTSMNKVQLGKDYAYKPEKYKPSTYEPANGYAMACGSEINQAMYSLGFRERMTTETKPPAIVGMMHLILFPYRNLDTKNDFSRLFNPTKELQKLHAPKPILMAVGAVNPPWIDMDAPLQIFRIGNIAVISTPFETTTVSSRRMRKRVKDEFARLGSPVDEVIYAGNSNGYISYMASPEEYEIQNYEGGSTNFGINQLPACEQELVRLAGKLINGQTGRITTDPEWVARTPNRVPAQKIIYADIDERVDRVPAGSKFGEQVKPLAKKFWKTGETFQVEFHSSNMNKNILHDKSFFEIQRFSEKANGWISVSNDDDFNTNLHWNKKTRNISTSTVIWRILPGTLPGKYRVLFNGYFAKTLEEQVCYSGESEHFEVVDGENLTTTTFNQKGKKVTIDLEKAINADMVIIRLAENHGKAITTAKLTINDKFVYPVRNITADGNTTYLYFPDLEVSSAKLEIKVLSDNSWNPKFEVFSFYDSVVSNDVKKFELYCR